MSLVILALLTVYGAAKRIEWGLLMILNKPRPEGGLVSPGALRVAGCVTLALPFFGIFSGWFDRPFPSNQVPIGQALVYDVIGFGLPSLAKVRSRINMPPSSPQ